MTEYVDTRGLVDRPRTFTEVLLDGIAPGGGLYVPRACRPSLPSDFLRFATQPYHERAADIYEAFGLNVPPDVIADIAAQAYGDNFDEAAVAPVKDLGDGRFVLELWHGPTLAFKDMALQCMPLFFSQALEQAHLAEATDLDFLVLVATSGDTGVAALNGFADRAHTKIVVYYPDAGVSAIQERQMTTQPGGNLSVFRVAGDFDACQSAVKAVFDDAAFADELAARLRLRDLVGELDQLGPAAAADRLLRERLRRHGRGRPRRLRRPHRRLRADRQLRRHPRRLLRQAHGRPDPPPALRQQHQQRARRLHRDRRLRHLRRDRWSRRPRPRWTSSSRQTSRDCSSICVATPQLIRQWMADLKAERRFAVDEGTRRKLQEQFTGAWVDNDTCLRTIGRVQREKGYLMDPHTAVAWKVAEDLQTDLPVLVVSTAHWSKFAADVVRGLTGAGDGEPVEVEGDDFSLLDRVTELAPGAIIPASLQAVRGRPVRFDTRIEGRREALEQSLRDWLANA